ncbi:hypothetical protein F4780DRAFT_774677 [Xylariomycetidae sp. FL0641]|nr:hypothetical protein F4780DRAFT_774677 [Xylariomycetidae sp. FL0641]
MGTQVDSYKEVTSTPAHGGIEVSPYYQPPVEHQYTSAHQSQDSAPAAVGPGDPRILGLRRPTFWLVVALAIVIVAAAVGGGVGGSIAVQNARSNCAAAHASGSDDGTGSPSPDTANSTSSAGATSTVTVEVPSATATGDTNILDLDCPNLDGTTEQWAFEDSAWEFHLSCGTDYSGHGFQSVQVSTLDDCLHACGMRNYFAGTDDCVAFIFHSNLTLIAPGRGNCVLKNSTSDFVENLGNDHASGALTHSS